MAKTFRPAPAPGYSPQHGLTEELAEGGGIRLAARRFILHSMT